ncbi:hypothetical protein BHM03_00040533 [Ensete ventricosum]|nr:hypothetical protein BHM03_00040533 [Ensete ventricosum]
MPTSPLLDEKKEKERKKRARLVLSDESEDHGGRASERRAGKERRKQLIKTKQKTDDRPMTVDYAIPTLTCSALALTRSWSLGRECHRGRPSRVANLSVMVVTYTPHPADRPWTSTWKTLWAARAGPTAGAHFQSGQHWRV